MNTEVDRSTRRMYHNGTLFTHCLGEGPTLDEQRGLSRTSGAKLAEVMVHMQVPPAEPLLIGQTSKNRVCLKVKIPLRGRDAFNQSEQPREILVKIRRTSAGRTVLIDFRRGLKSLRPSQWSSKRNPFDHRLIDPVGNDASGLFTDGNSKGVAEVTEHLM